MAVLLVLATVGAVPAPAGQIRTEPVRARGGMVVSEEGQASQVGASILAAGGNAVDAAVATAFALAVTHPAAGNLGGGGFLVFRPASGEPVAYDFRETAPAAATPTMFLVDGRYDAARHHDSHLAVGVPGTVAGLHLAWQEQGSLPWARLVEPAIRLARDGFIVSDGLSRSLGGILPGLARYPASYQAFTRDGEPYQSGEWLRQPDLARTLDRIAARGRDGFYAGETASLIVAEMQRGGGLITADDLAAYRAVARSPVRGSYRGYDILGMPPPSSGGTALVEMLNVLEGYDLADAEFGSARTVHLLVETMRRAFADRAQYLGDPEVNRDMPIDRLTSKAYAADLRRTIQPARASVSRPDTFDWPPEGTDTTHLSVVDAARGAVALTYTLEQPYGSRIVVPGAGFLLNNEMGDFNPDPGVTTATGQIGTPPNLVAPGKRMLSSMSPTIVARDGRLVMVTGSPGGRTIINTVLQTIVNVVDFGMNAQSAVDAPRVHHQWLPDRVQYEDRGLSPDTRERLAEWGHRLVSGSRQGAAQVIAVAADDSLEGGADRRVPGSTAVGVAPNP